LFTPSGKKEVTKATLISASKNSIFIGHSLPGTVHGVIAKGKSHVFNI
jgi:dihydroorotase-like cyclic amidohydrolase